MKILKKLKFLIKNHRNTIVFNLALIFLFLLGFKVFDKNNISDIIINHRIMYYYDSIPEQFNRDYSGIVQNDSLNLKTVLGNYLKKRNTDYIEEILLVEAYYRPSSKINGRLKIGDSNYYFISDLARGSIAFDSKKMLEDYTNEVKYWDTLLANRSFVQSEVIGYGGMIFTKVTLNKGNITDIKTTACYYFNKGRPVYYLKEKKENNYRERVNFKYHK